MDTSEVEEFYLEKKRSGMDYSKIREELKSQQVSSEEIKSIISSIDDKILREELDKSTKKVGLDSFYLGLFLLLGGLLLTLGTYFGLINLKGYYLVTYGPIIAGITLISRYRVKSKTKTFNNSRLSRFRK